MALRMPPSISRLAAGAALLAAALAATTTAAPARAGAFSPQNVPVDAKWVIHVDVDAIRATNVWKIVDARLQDNIDVQLKLQQVEDFIGVRFPDDVHDVTLFGQSFKEKTPVILMHLDINRDRVRNVLANAQDFATTTHNGHEVLSWEDKGKHIYGAFITDSFIAIGQSGDKVDQALDAIDGKAKSLAANTIMQGPNNAGVLLYAASDALAALQKQQKSTPVLNQMKGGWVAISERGEDLVVHALVQATSNEAAQKMMQSVQGIKAMLALATSSDHADPKLATVANALDSLTVAASGDQVKAEWPVKESTVERFIREQIAEKQARKDAATTEEHSADTKPDAAQ